MSVDLTIEEAEAIIVGAYEEQLLREGRLTRSQRANHDYSHAIQDILEGPNIPSPAEREKRFHQFVIDQFELRLSRSKDLLHAKICVQAGYCDNKGAEGLGLLVGALDGMLMAIIGYPIPTVAVAAWLIKTQCLDKLCKCEAS